MTLCSAISILYFHLFKQQKFLLLYGTHRDGKETFIEIKISDTLYTKR